MTRPCGFRFEARFARERVKSDRLDATCACCLPVEPERHLRSIRSELEFGNSPRNGPDRTGPRPAAGRGRGRVRFTLESLIHDARFSPSAGGWNRPDATSGVRSQRPAPRNKSTGLVLESHVTAALRHAQRETATQGSAQTLNTTTSGLMRCDSWRRAGRTSRQACGVPPPSRARGS